MKTLKKNLFTFSVLFSMMAVGATFSLMPQTANATESGLADAEGEKKARYIYCQLLGDRTGCTKDPTRTCSVTIFCR